MVKSKIRTILINILSSTIGNLLVFLLPHKANELSNQGVTLVMNNNLSIKERLMRRAILRKVEKKGDFDSLAKLHYNFWTNQGHNFYSEYENRLVNIDLPESEFIFDLLQEKLLSDSTNYQTLVEIGSGNGFVLSYLSSKFSQIDRFIGVDLSVAQTNLNKSKYANNSKLDFVASDIIDWIKVNGQNNTVFITFMGVLEYLSEQRLQFFLRQLKTLEKVIFVAIEPIGIDHDFNINSNSQTYGFERSFSHNYPKLFKDNGFNIWHFSKKRIGSSIHFMSYIGVQNLSN